MRSYDQDVVAILDGEQQRLAMICVDRAEDDPVRVWHFRRLLWVRQVLDRYVAGGSRPAACSVCGAGPERPHVTTLGEPYRNEHGDLVADELHRGVE